MKNKRGFTLIELLAVIVILGVILAIAGTAVIRSINDSREKAKYTAAREIVDIASAYMVAEKGEDNEDGTPKIDDEGCVKVEYMINDGYLENDVTNPLTGENISSLNDVSGQRVCKEESQAQDDYELQEDSYYSFDGYKYYVK